MRRALQTTAYRRMFWLVLRVYANSSEWHGPDNKPIHLIWHFFCCKLIIVCHAFGFVDQCQFIFHGIVYLELYMF